MIKLGYCGLAAIALLLLLSRIPGFPPVSKVGANVAYKIGNYIADEEQRQLNQESKKQITDFERMRQAEVEAGRVVKRVKPDGRIEYSMPSLPAPAPADSPTSTQ
jgi:hypothetical protein